MHSATGASTKTITSGRQAAYVAAYSAIKASCSRPIKSSCAFERTWTSSTDSGDRFTTACRSAGRTEARPASTSSASRHAYVCGAFLNRSSVSPYERALVVCTSATEVTAAFFDMASMIEVVPAPKFPSMEMIMRKIGRLSRRTNSFFVVFPQIATLAAVTAEPPHTAIVANVHVGRRVIPVNCCMSDSFGTTKYNKAKITAATMRPVLFCKK